MKLKEIKQMIKNGAAVDITNYSFENVNKLKPELTLIKTTRGVYGVNGAIFKDKNNKIYAIKSRNTNLSMLI